MNAIEFKPEIKLSFEEILQGISKLEMQELEDFSRRLEAVLKKRKAEMPAAKENGRKPSLHKNGLKEESRDKVAMSIKITSSRLDSVKPGSIYQVYDDAKNDERYVIDENNERVLFDKNIFKWEML